MSFEKRLDDMKAGHALEMEALKTRHKQEADDHARLTSEGNARAFMALKESHEQVVTSLKDQLRHFEGSSESTNERYQKLLLQHEGIRKEQLDVLFAVSDVIRGDYNKKLQLQEEFFKEKCTALSEEHKIALKQAADDAGARISELNSKHAQMREQERELHGERLTAMEVKHKLDLMGT